MNCAAVMWLLSLLVLAQPATASSLTPEEARQAAQGAVAEVLDALKSSDFRRLASYIGKEGLLLSPYVWMDPSEDVRLSRTEVERCAKDKHKRIWGAYDGSAASIRMVCRQYFREFVWKYDYSHPDETLYNEPRQRGLAVNNNHTLFPDAIIVELHLREIDSPWRGWSSLRLIFRKTEQGLFLIAVTRDVWTI